MGNVARIFLILSVCLGSVKGHGYIHSDEELAKLNKEAADLQKTLDGFSENLSGDLASKYKSLRSALEAYATAHAKNELNAAGTGWANAVDAAEKSISEEFIDLFRKLDSKQLEPQSELQFKRKDDELNRIYQALQANKNLDSDLAAAPSRRGIKDTQRKWIKYHDAWLAFAVLKFPAINKSSVETALTADRISRLRKIAAD